MADVYLLIVVFRSSCFVSCVNTAVYKSMCKQTSHIFSKHTEKSPGNRGAGKLSTQT